MYFAQVMAGGIGKRMGNTPMPKQFLMLGDKPIIIHTLEKFVLQAEFEKIIVSCPAMWIQHAEDTIKKYLSDSRIVVIEGGKERNDTLMAAINYIEANYEVKDDDVLVTHDAVRPFVTKRIIEDNMKAAKEYGAVDTGVPAFDTIVRVQNNEVADIPNRDEMYQGQTPQTFKINTFKRAFDSLTDEQKLVLPDSCRVCFLAGEKVAMVQGAQENMKVTTPHDLKIANALLEARNQ